ncbi:MAG TPA: deoxyribodipyrimidine photo-lyase [Candidatus Methylacidiphilales bacterium]|nr:deoxyribodipyrimidine photo-lyase [Candidatus Methylacidiphilales bacterium]
MVHEMGPVIVWFRQDLRLGDNPALHAARELIEKAKEESDSAETRHSIIPVFIWAPEEEGRWTPGGASRYWLHHSLAALAASLEKRGSRLILRIATATAAAPMAASPSKPESGTLAQLRDIIRETGARAVLWNRRYEPEIIARDKFIKEKLRADGLTAESYNAALLHEPWTIKNKSGNPFQVFTPYWRHCLTLQPPGDPLPAPAHLTPAPPGGLRSRKLTDLGLEPAIDWAAGIRHAWTPGESGAHAALLRFTAHVDEDASGEGKDSPGDPPLLSYEEQRNLPARRGTSRLSPHLHFGEISPRQIWHAVQHAAQQRHVSPPVWTKWQYMSEIGWREFSHHLIYHYPHTAQHPLREEFARFPWLVLPDNARPDLAHDTSSGGVHGKPDAGATTPIHSIPEGKRRRPHPGESHPLAEARRRYNAWTRGQTGYPLVDAGMRELWTTGWMHNRIRMVVASFLVKHLLLSWQDGAHWFWDTLVDADLAQNTAGWQWTAGCGADASPYFRIFNPITQGEKFDPKGEYIRRWIPQLRHLPDKYIHAPWTAPSDILLHAHITLGTTYPYPVVDHTEARKAALEALATLKI